MRLISVLAILFLFLSVAQARTVSVKGYYRKNGTYVQPHYRTSPNGTKLDNWSTKGNVNPYTGKEGTKDPYPESGSYSEGGTTNFKSGEGISETNSYKEHGKTPRSNAQLFERASEDCSAVRGSTTEAWCIKERIKNIKEIESLKSKAAFGRAFEDCSAVRGSTTEAWCIKERIKNIKEIESLKSKAAFGRAFEDCSAVRGSTSEAWCIKERIKNIHEIDKMKSQPNFDDAQNDCSSVRGSTSESWCIRNRMKNIAEIRKISGQ